MPTPKIVEIPEDENVVCPVCKTLVIDDEGLTEQPSCEHILFVFANAEAFEYDPERFEERLDAAQEMADEQGAYFDPWEWLSSQCDKRGVTLLEQNSEEMACGPVAFKVWVGIRKEAKKPRLRLLTNEEFSSKDNRTFFRPTARFVRWMKAQHGKQHVYDVGCGVGGTSKALAEAGLRVTAIDLQPRADSVFAVIQANSTEHQFEKDSVVMFCRPCHENGFVRDTILKALNCGIRAIVYVGLRRNVRHDLGGYFRKFVKHRVMGIGHADERIWEMTVSRLQANANLRRGAIPPLRELD
jgi:SAM-dependent methyltransferase